MDKIATCNVTLYGDKGTLFFKRGEDYKLQRINPSSSIKDYWTKCETGDSFHVTNAGNNATLSAFTLRDVVKRPSDEDILEALRTGIELGEQLEKAGRVVKARAGYIKRVHKRLEGSME